VINSSVQSSGIAILAKHPLPPRRSWHSKPEHKQPLSTLFICSNYCPQWASIVTQTVR